MGRRGEIDIIFGVLEYCSKRHNGNSTAKFNGSKLKTDIISHKGMTSSQWTKYLPRMIKNRLLQEIPCEDKKTRYKTTSDGDTAIDYYNQLLERLKQ